MNRITITILLATVALSGCATFKNPGPPQFASFNEQELEERIDLVVHLEMPEMGDLDDMIPDHTKRWVYNRAKYESERLIDILRKCELFKSVVTRRIKPDTEPIVTIKALPRKRESTGFEDPMILIYGGIFPIYSKENHGISFALVESNNDFHFEWTEEFMIGWVAPIISATNKNWSSKRVNEAYWNQLRTELLHFFKANESTNER